MLTLKKIHISSCTPERLAHVLKENQQGSRGNYIALLNMIKSSEVKQVCILVKNLSVIVAAFDKNCEDLVNEIISIDWKAQNDGIQSIFKHFLVSLLSSQPYYVNKIISMMLKSLSEVGPNDAVVIQKFSIDIIKITTDSVPSSLKQVQSGIKNNSPHTTRPVEVHQSFYRNMLALVDVIPTLFNDVVFEIISSVVKVDLDITQSTEGNVFAMEEEQGQGEENKLDLLLLELLLYIKTDLIRSAAWCKVILLTFDTLILPTHNPPYSPLIMFYYFNIYPASRSVLLDYLWSVFNDNNRSLIVRSSAVNYLCMFCAASQCVTFPDFAKILLSLSTWAHHYVVHKSGGANSIFYTAVQALCHMFCYRHTECSKPLIEEINFGGLVHSTLNPLKHLSNDILKTFNKVTSVYEIVMCNVIIERNNRLLIPSQQVVEMPLQPCQLTLTAPLIAPFYREPVFVASVATRASLDATLEDWDEMLRASSFSPSFTAMSLEDK